ncbi:DNA polymerase III subunit gamma/tau [Halosquirtibacter xylanolyticus]|uniref:DNA polymerase III subunit gamma/tau n=1 Tax=Halosquirtibacter xylanolyticus TaxID=3374599 RepID=UPI003749AB69|nr:DNA polymerase III subunit gamma/tau [Prolixibacteraceae bacterium]
MENFIVSARKYRPGTFASVVGQEAITNTLKNAIKTDHLAHAYLFCGPRGVGKTTCARLFAKTINCQNLKTDFEPCGTCESCTSFTENRSYNIHELDAASNNSVEDIRSLNDQVRIPPQIGKYSVYIIDEVHMLSQSAFNAFLKTLEEPPAHAIFILATTEKHKILATILSRCQIFDFNRMEISNIESHLQHIASLESISLEEDAANIIAQKADGAMRDALSIFDQVVSFCGDEVTYVKVLENLNVLDYDYYFKLIDLFLEADYLKTMLIFNEILSKGFEGQHFLGGLARHFRDLMVASDTVTIKLLEVSNNTKNQYKEQATKCSQPFLIEGLRIVSESDFQYKTSTNKRLHIELALIKLAQLDAKLKKKTMMTQ